MCKRLMKYVLITLLVLPVSLAPAVSTAGHIAMSQQSDGTLAYVGFMHSDKLAQNIKRYPKLYKSHDIGKIQTGRFKYHVTAVLFDADSNKRITDAEVRGPKRTTSSIHRVMPTANPKIDAGLKARISGSSRITPLDAATSAVSRSLL